MSLCTTDVTASNVKVEENQRKAVFTNSSNAKFSIHRIDGCMIKQSTAPDFVVVGPVGSQVGHLTVELKGADIVKAASQIDVGVALCKKQFGAKKIAGLIVCTRIPSFDSTAQKLKNRFSKEHGARLSISRVEYRGGFEQLF